MEIGLYHNNTKMNKATTYSLSDHLQTPKNHLSWKIFVKFSIIPLVPLLILAIISTNPNLWVVDGNDHFYFEVISVILSFIVAYYCILRVYVLKNKFSLFIGLGFLVAGIIDLLHGTFAILNVGDSIFEGYFIPQTWVASRIVMGSVFLIAIIRFNKWQSEKISGTLRKTIFLYTVTLSVLATFVTGLSLIQPFPFVTIDFIIQRPYEIFSATLFLSALLIFYKNRIHQKKDIFYKGLLITLLVDIFVNLIISYSTFVFDTSFNIAHLLKNISYFILILAISGSIVYHFNLKNILSNKLETNEKRLLEFNTKIMLNEQKFRDLYENSSTLLRTIDINGRILDCNQVYAKSLGYTKKDIIGSSIFSHVPKNKHNEMMESFETWKRIGRVGGREIFLQRKDGTVFPVLLTASGIYDKKGNLVGSNTSITDLTAINKAREEIQKEKIKRLTAIGELSARIAHDLRNPMSVIKNTLEIIEMELDIKHNEKIRKKFERIDRAITRINHQVEDVLDFIRDKPLQLENTSVQSILTYVLERINIPSEVTINLPENNTKIYCDFEKLEIVFVNLITNAIQAMTNKGEINITVSDKEDQVLIAINDSGPGIPEKSLSKVFDPLFTTRQIGTGLGLASCKNIVEKHGGTIDVETKLGVGTTFIVKLPKNPNLVTVQSFS